MGWLCVDPDDARRSRRSIGTEVDTRIPIGFSVDPYLNLWMFAECPNAASQ